MSLTVSSPAGTASTTSTLAPSRAAAIAVARPIPLAAPVINATLPCRSPAILSTSGKSARRERPDSARRDLDMLLRHEESHPSRVDKHAAITHHAIPAPPPHDPT